MTAKASQQTVTDALDIWTEAAKSKNWIVVFGQTGYFGNQTKAAADLLVACQIIRPLKENRVIGVRSVAHSLILTSAVQKEYMVSKDAPLEVLSEKVINKLLEKSGVKTVVENDQCA